MKRIVLPTLRDKFNHQIDATGLAWFRIIYALVLFLEIKHIANYNHLIYDSIPYLSVSDVDLNIAFKIWLVSTFFIFLGLFTRISTIINYLISIILIGSIGDFEYHVFYAYMGINFIIIFLPISRVWSIDRLILKLKYSNSKFHYNPPSKTSVFSYWIPLFVGIGLVYFDSIFYKLTDPIWSNGLGMWWPASHVCASFIALPEILNQKWLMLFLGYLTIIFELVFIFLFYFKSVRWIFWFIGMGLHVGILIFFPIPFFALAVISIYVLLIPVSFYEKFKTFKMSSRVTFYYDGDCPLCARTKIILDHFNIFGVITFKTVQSEYGNDAVISKIPMDDLLNDIHAVDCKGNVYKGFNTYKAICKTNFLLWPFYVIMLIPGVSWIGNKIYFWVSRNRITERCTDDSCGIPFIQLPKRDDEVKILKNITLKDVKFSAVLFFAVFCTIIQTMLIYSASPMQSFFSDQYKNGLVNQTLVHSTESMHKISKSFLGLTHHAVFGHYHFANRDDLIKVEFVDESGQRQLLPITQNDGRPGTFISGCSWVQWNFRVLNSDVDSQSFNDGIKRYTAYWLKKNKRGDLNGHFILYHKTMSVPDFWEKDVLKRDLENLNWKVIGSADWKNNTYSCEFMKFD